MTWSPKADDDCHQWFRNWIPWFVLVFIVSLSAVVATMLYRVQDENHHSHFSLTAVELVRSLQSGLNLRFRPVQHVAAVFAHEEGYLSENSFRLLAESIALIEQPGLVALRWIAREVNDEGQASFHIQHTYSRRPVGIEADRGLNTGARLFLERAVRRPHLSISPWYQSGDVTRFQVARPVFRNEGGAALGLVSAVYDVAGLLKDVLCPIEMNGLAFFLSDPLQSTGERFTCVDGEALRVAADARKFHQARRHDAAIDLYGSRWHAEVVAAPGTFTAPPLASAAVVVVGIGFGIMLLLYLRDQFARECEIRQLVERRTDELDRSNDQLRAMNSELEEFAYAASHDLKAPLRAVSQLSSWIDEDAAAKLDDENRNRLRLMRERVVRMDQLIDGLLAYSRAGRVTGDVREAVPLRPLLEQLLDDLALPPGFRVELNGFLPALGGDRLHLKQVFQNLLTNAAWHHPHPESGHAWVRAIEERHDWRIEVADDGTGIPAEERENVFKIFISLGKPNGEKHTGIGLALVRKLVLGYGGRVDAIDNPPHGALFRIWWPK